MEIVEANELRELDVNFEGFKGSVWYDHISVMERMDLNKEVNYKKNDKEEWVRIEDGLDIRRNQVKLFLERVKKIDLKFGKRKFTSVRELEAYNEGYNLMIMVSEIMLMGETLGKN